MAERRGFDRAAFREIHKNTWLKKITTTNLKKKKEKMWVVFCIHDDTDAFLELYINNIVAVMHKPNLFISLNTVQHISPTLLPCEQDYEFVLSFSSEVVRLAASSWDQMLDWVTSLRDKLHELRILNPKENVYTKLPEIRNFSLLPTRDPTSPLPLPPSGPPILLPGTELHEQSETNFHFPPLQRSVSESSGSSRDQTSEPTTSEEDPIFDLVHFNDNNETESPNETTSSYEYLFNLPETPGTSNRQQDSGRDNLEQQKTLREQQVLQLQKEIKHPHGIRLCLSRKDCVNSIALVDAFNSVWVCGWKQKEYPMHYNVLHIGDQFLSINNKQINSVAEAHILLKSLYTSRQVDIVIKRIPYGKIFILHRDMEGQSLGIIQKNNTAVIESIEANSVAEKCGLSTEAKSFDGLLYTNWIITEINGRPLNLFCKKGQVKDRLNSVGKDISILVQPLDFIKQLKKQLKSLKNYKDYVLE